MSLAEQTLGEIACNILGATRLFRQYQMDFCCGGARVLREEAKHKGVNLEKMLALTHQLRLPEGACNSWRALYLGASELRDDIMEHIHLENNILFKQQAISSPSVCCGHCG